MASKTLRLPHTLSKGRQIVADRVRIHKTLSQSAPFSGDAPGVEGCQLLSGSRRSHDAYAASQSRVQAQLRKKAQLLNDIKETVVVRGFWQSKCSKAGRELKSNRDSSIPSGEHNAIRLGFCRHATCSKSISADQACRHSYTEIPPAEHTHTRNGERSLNAFQPRQTNCRGADRKQCAATSTHREDPFTSNRPNSGCGVNHESGT
jgi:hypothetical protein